MGLPENIAVRISSEAAEGLALTPVVRREFPLWEFLETMLAATGKDANQIRELLVRGSLVIGASRFRWVGFNAKVEDIASLLQRFPDADPQRPFVSECCVEVVFHSPAGDLIIGREDALRKRWFRRKTFWEELFSAVSEPSYVEYSYRRKADVYRSRFSPAQQDCLRTASALLAFGGLRVRLGSATFSSADFFVVR